MSGLPITEYIRKRLLAGTKSLEREVGSIRHTIMFGSCVNGHPRLDAAAHHLKSDVDVLFIADENCAAITRYADVNTDLALPFNRSFPLSGFQSHVYTPRDLIQKLRTLRAQLNASADAPFEEIVRVRQDAADGTYTVSNVPYQDTMQNTFILQALDSGLRVNPATQESFCTQNTPASVALGGLSVRMENGEIAVMGEEIERTLEAYHRFKEACAQVGQRFPGIFSTGEGATRYQESRAVDGRLEALRPHQDISLP